MRNTKFAVNEYYHIYNRGTDKRSIFEDSKDLQRFLKGLNFFNKENPIGSIFEYDFVINKQLESSTPKQGALVNIIAYCLNQNHYHLILEPLVDKGVQKFMHKLSTGYTNYFNEKYKRSGVLFQGRYKSIHIETNEYLLHLSVYVNLNDKVHKNLNKDWMSALLFSSWSEYTANKKDGFCKKDIILDQFSTIEKYKKYAIETLPDIIKRKKDSKLLLE